MSTRSMQYRDWVSTTEAAEMCGVSHMTIIRCFDSGELKGYRVPGSRHRRLPKTSLVEFAQGHNLPNPLLEGMADAGESHAGADEKARALIVEDDAEIRSVMQKLLEKDGWEVRVAENGFEAGFLAACFVPELILLDIMLPGMDGRDVCRQLRKDPKLKSVKIIAVTALTDQKSKADIFEAGVDDYRTKPFTVNELLGKIVTLTETVAEEVPAKN